jgi:hypothetical protein
MQDCKHRPRSCDDSASQCESQAGWNFRKGQGEAWPGAEKELKPPTRSGEIRGWDKRGGGGFLNPRSDNGVVRFHGGVDYTVHRVGEPIFATMSGWVEREARPYKEEERKGLTGLILKNERGYTSTIFYIDPTPEIKNALKTPTLDGITKNRYKVEAGETVIGHAQNLHPIYPNDVPLHVHVTLRDPQGRPVSPDGKIRITRKPKEP